MVLSDGGCNNHNDIEKYHQLEGTSPLPFSPTRLNQTTRDVPIASPLPASDVVARLLRGTVKETRRTIKRTNHVVLDLRVELHDVLAPSRGRPFPSIVLMAACLIVYDVMMVFNSKRNCTSLTFGKKSTIPC